jgi:hypothetical protein
MLEPEQLASSRYFFHLVSDDEVIRDETGVHLATKEGVPLCAARAIAELQQEGFFAVGAWQGWQIDITDGAGQTILSVPLGNPDLEQSLRLN